MKEKAESKNMNSKKIDVITFKRELKMDLRKEIEESQCRAVFVDRFNRDKAIVSLKSAQRRLKLNVSTFPEGTRNHGNRMIEFKKDAFNLSVFVTLSFLCKRIWL
ncbi:hypothetical protein LOAG_14124 [Loa loa]|uniref:Phospholipid/glycerol acyltransferase domain-containing protein n=1 Tax=Loa loa TaxID=7209 RepID=A0A1S0TIB6_LOALO|nr:hypothetical protein LOAG_14124 [Loa loa]EFO14395.1 hypothetical protein LOAG_14124 [Loa loa]